MNCTLCSVAQKHVPARIIYEDSVCCALLASDPATLGHIQVLPKQHFQNLEEIPDAIATQLFYAASYAASAVYEGLASHGTNIICNNGAGAGAKGHIVIEIIPRKENDGLNYLWEPKKLGPNDFDDAVKKLKDKADYISLKKEKKEKIVQEAAPVIIGSGVSSPPSPSGQATIPAAEHQENPTNAEVVSKDEENYMIKHLYRRP
ncbi:HIT family protein [Candidatus Woesearchaeota archaeon]|nr:HIT family protein [Candidatus Woesearchaeota archaeon]